MRAADRPPSVFSMEQINDFFPFENTAEFDIERQLRWSNETILQSIAYYNAVCGESVDYDKIIDELRSGSLRAYQALLYGALKAVDKQMSFKRYAQIYKADEKHAIQYFNAVLDGMNKYLPVPKVLDSGENLDPEWPDTQDELKKKESSRRQTGDTGSGSAKKKASTGKRSSTRR